MRQAFAIGKTARARSRSPNRGPIAGGVVTWELHVDFDDASFLAAVDWFAQRVPLTEQEFTRSVEQAARQAFWIAGVTQADMIRDVHKSLAAALDKGVPFEEWQKQVGPMLAKAWIGQRIGEGQAARTETILRNWAQSSYSRARKQQMAEPAIKRLRPYRMFDAVRDGRTSEICKECDGTVLPADDPWWDTHQPPLHHRCRSGIRSLTERKAKQLGITTKPPRVGPQGGFGTSEEWQGPDRERFPKGVKPPPAPKPIAPAPPEPPKLLPSRHPGHDPAHWEPEYAQYGDAAPAVAWGRAMLERGLDRPAGEVVAELRRLKSAGHPSLERVNLSYAERLPAEKPLRGTPAASALREFITLAEHTRSVAPQQFAIGGETSSAAMQGARKFFDLTLDRSVAHPAKWAVRIERGVRAHAHQATAAVVLEDSKDVFTAVHELAHAVEFVDARALARSLAFVRARTRGEELQSLQELTGEGTYGPSEQARPDKFFHPYVGKTYDEQATEVTSMGYEQLARDPRLLARRDWDMLLFLLGQLAGK